MTDASNDGDVPATKADVQEIKRKVVYFSYFLAMLISAASAVILAGIELPIYAVAMGLTYLVCTSAMFATGSDGINRRLWYRVLGVRFSWDPEADPA